jgi:S1-C subfamily serine protease
MKAFSGTAGRLRAVLAVGLGLLGAALAGGARAENWVQVGMDVQGTTYEIDLATTQRSGDIAKSWMRERYTKRQKDPVSGKGYVVAVVQRFDDCRGRRFQFGAYARHNEKGDVASQGPGGSAWQEIAPGSIGEVTWKTACRLSETLPDKPLLADITAGAWTRLSGGGGDSKVYSVRLDQVAKLEDHKVAALIRTDLASVTMMDGYPVRYVVNAIILDCAQDQLALMATDEYVAPAGRVWARRYTSSEMAFSPLAPNGYLSQHLAEICTSARDVSDDQQQAQEGGEGGGKVFTGTAWGINKGYLATAYHVIDGARTIEVYSDGEPVGEAIVVAADPANDLALLKLKPVAPMRLDILPLAERGAGLGRGVFTLGYPAPGVMGQHVKMTAGEVSATSGMQDDARFLQISVPIQGGNSGGPVIAWDGTVVGVVDSSLTKFGEKPDPDQTPELVNYAVKAAYLRPMLEDLPDLGNYALVRPAAGQDGLVAAARKAVFMLVVTQ